jgi:hypothetical protein
LPFGNYLIFYSPIADGVIVLRFLHRARNLPELFRPEKAESPNPPEAQ